MIRTHDQRLQELDHARRQMNESVSLLEGKIAAGGMHLALGLANLQIGYRAAQAGDSVQFERCAARIDTLAALYGR